MEHRVNNKRQATGLPKGIEERVVNAEDYLNLSPDESKSVFERLKVIENKILHLESVSPEYSHFLVRFHFDSTSYAYVNVFYSSRINLLKRKNQ